MTEGIWRNWSRRNAVATAIMMFGVGCLAVAVFRAVSAAAVIGVLMLVMACVYRARAAVNYWVTCRLDEPHATVIVSPTHPTFDAQAEALFTQSLR